MSFKIIQRNPGKWLGIFYTQSQATSSYMTFVNFGMTALNLWALWELKIKEIVPWFNLWLFITVFVLVAVTIGVCHYIFVQKPMIIFQNEQACKHENPVMRRFDDLEKAIKELRGDKNC